MRTAVSFLLLSAAIAALASTKTEDILRAQLAQAQAQAAQAAKDKAALADALAKLNAAATIRATAAASTDRAAASGRAKASDLAQEYAEGARVLAQLNAQISANAASNVQNSLSIAAVRAESAANSSKSQNTALLIVQCAGLLAILLKFGYDGFTRSQDHRWAEADAAARTKQQAESKHAVLAAVASGQAASNAAIDQANHLTQKIVDMRQDIILPVAGLPDAIQGLIDTIAGHTVDATEIGKVLGALKAKADADEIYAHTNVHRLNDAFAAFLAQVNLNKLKEPPAA